MVKIVKWFLSTSIIPHFFIPLKLCCCHNYNLYYFTPFLSKSVDLGNFFFFAYLAPCDVTCVFIVITKFRQIFVLILILLISLRQDIIHVSIHLEFIIERWLSELYYKSIISYSEITEQERETKIDNFNTIG